MLNCLFDSFTHTYTHISPSLSITLVKDYIYLIFVYKMPMQEILKCHVYILYSFLFVELTSRKFCAVIADRSTESIEP
jgi:hypothetical protein